MSKQLPVSDRVFEPANNNQFPSRHSATLKQVPNHLGKKQDDQNGLQNFLYGIGMTAAVPVTTVIARHDMHVVLRTCENDLLGDCNCFTAELFL